MTEVPANVTNDHGHPLPRILAEKMGRLFDADFSDVRIAESSLPAACGTIAVAYGEEIRFAPGVIDGWSVTAERILAHELTHVLQYRAGRAEEWPGQFEQEAMGSQQSPTLRTVVAGARSNHLGTKHLRGYTICTTSELADIDLQRSGDLIGDASQQTVNGSFLGVDGRANVVSTTIGTETRFMVSDQQQMLIEYCVNSSRQAKLFFATNDLVQSTNRLLAATKLRLFQGLPQYPYFRNGSGQELRPVRPMLHKDDGRLYSIEGPQTCAEFADYLGAPADSRSGWEVAAALADLPPPGSDSSSRSNVAYRYSRVRFSAEERLHDKVNEFANPSVGARIYSGSVIGDDVVSKSIIYDYSSPRFVRAVTRERLDFVYRTRNGAKVLTPVNVPHFWGDHVGTVAARDGDDIVVLMDYGRSADRYSARRDGNLAAPPDLPVRDSNDPVGTHYFQMYSIATNASSGLSTLRKTWHYAWDGTAFLEPENEREILMGLDGAKAAAISVDNLQPYARPRRQIRRFVVQKGKRVLVNPVTVSGPKP